MLKGNIIDLIPVEEKHIEIIRKWRMQEEIYDYMFSAEPITDLAQKKWFEKISTDKGSYYFVIQLKDGQPIGLASLNDIDYKNGTTGWGYYIGDLKYSNLGGGAEAEYLILKYAFEFLRLNKVWCFVYSTNKNVISMHKRFGFVHEGVLRQQYYHKNAYQDVVVMGMLKDEYEGNKIKIEKIFNCFGKKKMDESETGNI